MVDKYDLSSIRSITFGAAPMDEIAVNQFQRKFPKAVLQQGIINMFSLFKDNCSFITFYKF